MGSEWQEQASGAALGLWMVDVERGFVGTAAPEELSRAILGLARRASASDAVLSERVLLAPEGGSEPVTIQLVARPAGSGVVAVASHPLGAPRQADVALSRLELILRATHEAMWDWSAASGAWWNLQQYELLGHDPQSTPPSLEAWQCRIHPDDRERVQRDLQQSLASDATLWQCEYRLLRGGAPDVGEVRVVLDRGCIQRDEQGRVVRMAGVISDITAERETTAALRASEERFREMTAAIDHFFWVCNPEGTRALYVSPAYEKIWGRSVESVYRDARSVMDAIHEDDVERVRARQHLKIEGSYDETYRIHRADGTIAWIRSRAFPIRDSQGNVVRVAGIAMDITAQRRLEQQLAQAQRLESIGRLAGGIAHDFNNLLTVILGSVDLQLLDEPGDALRADLGAIKEAGERAATLTSQLLSFARRQPVAPARLDLAQVARQTEQLLRRVIGEHVELHTSFDSEPCTVLADRAQLEQVLVNLVLNARDAMPQGGRLGIEALNVSIGLPGSDPAWRRAELEPGEYVALAISDSGIGISSDVLPHVFEPFFTTKPTGRGSGLGLATCYGIIQQAGGVILVDTQLGAGTTFTILLPRAQPEQAKPSSWRTRGSISGGTETLLFVEDDPGVRRVGMQILAAHHYSVLVAGSGAEALELVAAAPAGIQLLVTDVVMPSMSGPELARRLRATQPQLRVLYCSGYTEDALVRQSGNESRTGFLPKPYTRETLLEKVRALLDADG
ncbi:MAG TPA: PAS domain-containing protein [Polyangiaceae bacterium]|nr:PAS domain-containing protein [Polyangiaceae bacterium]